MSEYQYYEFQTIDRQLTDRQMRELRAISSRATISRTRFSNYYTYGDLKANPRDLLVQYFDASLSFAHWFYVELAFRFPKTAVDMRGLRRYAAGQSLDVRSTGGDVIVAVAVERDDFDPEDDGQGWLSSVTAIRADIAGGDARALYFAWLLDVQSGEIDDDVVEPARPDGLGSHCLRDVTRNDTRRELLPLRFDQAPYADALVRQETLADVRPSARGFDDLRFWLEHRQGLGRSDSVAPGQHSRIPSVHRTTSLTPSHGNHADERRRYQSHGDQRRHSADTR